TADNIAAHTGWLIGPPGDQADATFVFYFTDTGFSNAGQDGGTDTGTGSDTQEPKVIYSGTAAASDDPETFVALTDFGSGATFDANVTTDASFDRVFSVTSGEGYGAGVHVAFAAFTGYSAGFATGIKTFNAKVKGSPDGRIEVKLIGSGTDSVAEINVNTYTGSTDLGNGWFEITIPISEFNNNSADNIAAHTGWLIGPPGDQADETFVFYFTDVEFGYVDEDVVADTANYQLVWSNEFNGGTLDNWNIETGYGPNTDGWGNDESQLYTNSATNITIDNGSLVITARCDLSVSGVCGKRDDSITSARVTTKDKMEFRYGKVEARIKVPDGTSTWPALWMLGASFPDTPWPNAGEIDIMEVWQTGGSTLNQSNSTIHYFDGGRVLEGDSIVLADSLADDFRVWTMEWKPNSISVSVEGEEYLTLDTSDAKYAAFKEPFFLLMNIAIDGTLGGTPEAIVNTPQTMLVDYVRLYQDTENTENIFNETAQPTTPDKVLYSAVSASNDDPETFVALDNFGSGATFDASVTTDASFDRVFSVTSGEGYGAGVHVAFAAFTGYTAGFASGYDTFNAKVKGSPDGRIEVKLIGSGTDSVVEVNVNSYGGSTDLGNGWYELAIPISEFNNNGADNIAAHTGWLIGPPGDQADETFIFYFTDTGFSGS
ncbi:MAG: glycoside hydrolase family 16 protein, partial [Thiotrichales bacterium]|nr:glycoside hydrolase family 16 protein [Thiotrichales bacterium]